MQATRWTVLFDPRVVVEVLQTRELKTAEALMLHCATSGIRFLTPCRVTIPNHVDHGLQAVQRDDRLAALKRMRLGYHAPEHKSTVQDYVAYWRDCGSILKDPMVASAALKLSGFAWRIAIAVLHPGCVLAGPSDDARVYGLGKSLKLMSGTEAGDYVDDDLLKEIELFLIGGFYTVDKRNEEIQYVKTFFPPASVFACCDTGSWTARWEQLFQELDAGYVSPTLGAQPVAVKTWLNRYRNRDKPARRLWVAAERHAKDLLSSRPELA
jgi:hypothetical protein